jgi:hypothetical protein
VPLQTENSTLTDVSNTSMSKLASHRTKYLPCGAMKT